MWIRINKIKEAFKKTSLKDAAKKALNNTRSKSMVLDKKVENKTEKKKEEKLSTFDIEKCIGKKEEEVKKDISNNKMICHIARRDDESFVKSTLYDKNRVSIEIEAGMVVSAMIG